MSFSPARVALGGIPRRALELGDGFPQFETSSATGGGSTTERTITAPAGIVEDDLLLMLICLDGRSGQIITPPSDTTPWIELIQDVDSPNNAHTAGIWYKVATGVSEPASYEFSSNFSEVWGMYCYRLSNVDTANPINAFSYTIESTQPSLPIPAFDYEMYLLGIITTRTNCLLIHSVSSDQNLSDSIHDNGAPDVVDLITSYGGTSGVRQGLGREEFAPGGGTGNRLWHLHNNVAPDLEERSTALIAINPPIEIPSFLELEGSSDKVLFEDNSGLLKLE